MGKNLAKCTPLQHKNSKKMKVHICHRIKVKQVWFGCDACQFSLGHILEDQLTLCILCEMEAKLISVAQVTVSCSLLFNMYP